VTVKELREFLARFPDNALVVMFSDGEGNGVSPLSEAYRGRYQAENGWSGVFATDSDDERDGEIAVAFTPIN
jgi:hypothetical protein